MRRTIDYGERGQVTVERNAMSVAALAAEEFVMAYLQAEKQRRSALVSLSGGSTPQKLFEIFKDLRFRHRVVWERMQLFWGDERWVPLEDDESNAGAAKRGFIDEIGMGEENWHPWPTYLDDPNEAATAYEASIRIVAHALDGTPVFDLIFLGMGADGHTASLFPGTDAVHEQSRLAIAHEVPKLGSTRLTMTPMVINNAKEVLFLVTGEDKAEMLHKVLDGPVDIDAMPSQAIRPEHGRLRWYVDEAAAGQLERS